MAHENQTPFTMLYNKQPATGVIYGNACNIQCYVSNGTLSALSSLLPQILN